MSQEDSGIIAVVDEEHARPASEEEIEAVADGAKKIETVAEIEQMIQDGLK